MCGFCSLCAPDTTFSALCTALVAVVFTAFTTSRFMCWVFRCHCACLYEAYTIYLIFCLYDIIMILQHHILCRFLEVGPCPPAQAVGSCPVNRAVQLTLSRVIVRWSRMGAGTSALQVIDGSHTCLVLFSTHTAHIRAVGTPHTTHLLQRTLRDTLLNVGTVT